MPPSRESAAVTPGDNRAGHSLISAGSCAAVLRTIASRRQPIQRIVSSAKGDASAPARSPFVHLVICAAWVFLCSGAPFDGSVRAKPASIAGTASPTSALPFTASSRRPAEIQYSWQLDSGGMRIESGGDPRAVSPKGAMGLMQIMPKTYAGFAPAPSRPRRLQSA